MNNLHKFRYYLNKCNTKKLIDILINKHEKEEERELNDNDILLLISSYKVVFEKLKAKYSTEESNFIIHIEYGNKNDEGNIVAFLVHKSGCYYPNTEIEFLTWDKWVNSDIYYDSYTQNKMEIYGVEYLVAECIWIITYYGFDERTIKEQELEQNFSLNNAKKVEKKGKLSSYTVEDLYRGNLVWKKTKGN